MDNQHTITAKVKVHLYAQNLMTQFHFFFCSCNSSLTLEEGKRRQNVDRYTSFNKNNESNEMKVCFLCIVCSSNTMELTFHLWPEWSTLLFIYSLAQYFFCVILECLSKVF